MEVLPFAFFTMQMKTNQATTKLLLPTTVEIHIYSRQEERAREKERFIAELWLLLLAVSVSACLPGIVLHLQKERKRKNEMSIVMMSTVAVVVVDE